MNTPNIPPPYESWSSDKIERAEDAARTFGYHLMQHCRNEAISALTKMPVPQSHDDFHKQAMSAVDTALHNVMDLLEGFWPTQTGPNHRVSYALGVCISDANHKAVERIDISPCLIDLPIAYWGFTEGEFQ